MCVCVYIIFICVYIYMCMYMCICMCAYIYIYVSGYTNRPIHRNIIIRYFVEFSDKLGLNICIKLFSFGFFLWKNLFTFSFGFFCGKTYLPFLFLGYFCSLTSH